MRDIPAALQTHINSEVTSLARCIKITKADGTVLRLTLHDADILFSGDTYLAGVPMDISALQSSDSLAVDNAELTVGIDGTIIKQDDLDGGQFDNAVFELFIVNWENPGDGAIYLKKGTFGDIEVVNNVTATIQLRGLTQSLQRPIVERYSPTCRVNLGGKKCGVVNSPVRLRRPKQKVKTFDWYLVASEAHSTAVVVDNPSFESASIPASGWNVPDGSSWNRADDFSAEAGNWYAEGGSGVTGQEQVLYQDFAVVADLSMDTDLIDNGSYSFDLSCVAARTSEAIVNSGKVYIEQYDSNGNTLRREDMPYETFDYQVWRGIGMTCFVLPGTRTIRIGLVNRIDSGSAGKVAFDNVSCKYFLNEMDTWGGAVFRTVKLPAFASDEKLRVLNFSFETATVANTNVAGAISGWTTTTDDWWQVVTSLGALAPTNGNNFLAGGNNGSGTASQEYDISFINTLANDPWGGEATAQNITDGWYYAQLNVDVGRSDSDSAPRAILQFLAADNSVIASEDTGYLTTALTTGVMATQTLYARVPSNTAKIKIILRAKSGAAGSAANVAFDNVELFFMPTAYEHDDDPELAHLAADAPAYDYTQLNYTRDGDAIVQARPIIFGYAAVTGLLGDNRSFEASSISNTAAKMYSGRVTWLSGANAGRVSFIRIWDDTLKTAKLYESLPADIAVGDKFVYAEGCDKTLDRCFALGNVHNMRAEPYLPGPNKVIEFLVADTEG